MSLLVAGFILLGEGGYLIYFYALKYKQYLHIPKATRFCFFPSQGSRSVHKYFYWRYFQVCLAIFLPSSFSCPLLTGKFLTFSSGKILTFLQTQPNYLFLWVATPLATCTSVCALAGYNAMTPLCFYLSISPSVSLPQPSSLHHKLPDGQDFGV